MNILVIDIGGTHVKLLATGQTERSEFVSGPRMTPSRFVAGVRKITKGWSYDAIAMGYPGFVLRGRPVAEPHNLAPGWVRFDFAKAFRKPVRIINDAAMQALGSYRKGKMLFLGLGTGLGSAMVVDGILEPMELAHLPYRKGTFEDYVGLRALEGLGKRRWRKEVSRVVDILTHALEPDEIVLGGGNVVKLKKLPPLCRAGSNDNAFTGGFRLWDDTPSQTRKRPAARAKR